MFGQTSGRAGLEAAKYTQKRRLSRPCNDRLSCAWNWPLPSRFAAKHCAARHAASPY